MNLVVCLRSGRHNCACAYLHAFQTCAVLTANCTLLLYLWTYFSICTLLENTFFFYSAQKTSRYLYSYVTTFLHGIMLPNHTDV